MDPLRIAVIGGTGAQGRGLALRFARAGHRVRIGSRDVQRAVEAATDLTARPALAGAGTIEGGPNVEVAEDCDLAVLSVPYRGQAEVLGELAAALEDRVVVTCVNPLAFDERGPYALVVDEGSAAEQAAAYLAGSRVVAAFHHLPAAGLSADGPPPDDSVLVCGDDEDAKALVTELCGLVALRGGVDAGPLRLARHLEAMTAVLLQVNRRYRTTAGIAITGLPDAR